MTFHEIVSAMGALAFGLVVGWITYRTLRWKTGPVGLSDLSAVLGAVGGAAVTSLFDTPYLFGAYGIGLAVGFFGYFIQAGREERRLPEDSPRPDKPQPGGPRHGWMGGRKEPPS